MSTRGVIAGEWVADAEVTEPLSFGCIVAFRAVRENGEHVAVLGPAAGLSDGTVDRFLAGASSLAERLSEPIDGIAVPSAVDPLASAVVIDADPKHSLATLEDLGWQRGKKIAFIDKLVRTVARLHEHQIVHGCLCPDVVLLRGGLEPLITCTGSVSVAEEFRETSPISNHLAPYAAPEVRFGRTADFQADVYALGRLIQFVLTAQAPEGGDEALPELASLEGAPSGLINIVRKCTTADPTYRYDDVRAVFADVKLYKSKQPVGLSADAVLAPKPMPSQRPGASVPRPRPSLRPSASPSSAEDSAGPPGKKKRFRWSPALAVVCVVVGAALLAGAIVGARMTGSELHWGAMSLVAPWWIAAIVPPLARHTALARLGVAIVGMAVVLVLDPTVSLGTVEAQDHQPVKGADVAARVAHLEQLRSDGERYLTTSDLAGADLSGLDLQETNLSASVLKNANCQGTNFRNAVLLNVDLTGADLSGADLAGTEPALARGFRAAKCDDKTVLPSVWTCIDGAPTPKK